MPDSDFSVQDGADTLRPVQQGERILELDVIRGFALFGVLMAYALWNLGSPPEETYSQTDYLLNRVLAALIDTKAYTLLATLFGLGFSIQMRRAEIRGSSSVPVYCRRLFVLLLIGLIHALLLRNGDILVPYSVMGFVLLLFRNASNRMLAVAAFVALLFPYLAQGVWTLTGLPFPQRPATEGMNYIAGNVAWVRYWYLTAITNWPGILPMFLFGLYLGRRNFFENISRHRKTLWRLVIVGFSTGILALAGVELLNRTVTNYPQVFGLGLAARLLWTLHAWGMAAFYASSLILLLQKKSWQKRLAPLAAVGRMALTNYLLQSIIIVPVCIVFNLFDKVTPTIGVLLALGVWMLQVPASVLWLKHFQFGPAEWVWRKLTYGNLRPVSMIGRQAAVPEKAGLVVEENAAADRYQL